MKPVYLYTTPICPYCINAKALLSNKGVAFSNISMSDLPKEELDALRAKTGNYRTVPQIFIGDTFIGGFSELSELERTGKLDALLAD